MKKLKEIEKWSVDYCSENGITYEELIDKSLKYFKKYDENQEFYNYVSSKEFKNVITNMNKILKKSEEKWYVINIKAIADKEEYIKQHNLHMKNFIFDKDCELYGIYKKDKLFAYVVLSFENDSLGEYAFLHAVDFVEETYISHYNKIQNIVEKICKSKGIMYLDRIVKNATEEEIKESGYYNIYVNINVKIDLITYKDENADVQYNKENSIENSYELLYKICPERFEKTIEEIYKINNESGSLYVAINIREREAAAKLYFEKNKMEDKKYIKSSLKLFLNFCKDKGLEEVYTSLLIEHNMILENIIHISESSKLIWIRKPL